MSNNDENIIWDENPSIKFNFPAQKTQQPEKKVIKEKEYSSLYEELKDKLNPENYMGDNYDAEKLEICNDLYSQLLQIEETNEEQQKHIRNEAIDKLQLHFSSKKLYKELSEYCDPKQFMNPYNKEMVNLANECYKYVQDNKDNILQLENIAKLGAYSNLYNYKEERRIEEEILRKERELKEKQELERLAEQCERERAEKLQKEQEEEIKKEKQRQEYLEKLKKQEKEKDKALIRALIVFFIIIAAITIIIVIGYITSSNNYATETITETISENKKDELSFTTYSNKWYSISYPSEWRYQELDSQLYMMDVYIGAEDESVGFSIFHFPTDYTLQKVNNIGNEDLEKGDAKVLSNNLQEINGFQCYVSKLKLNNHTQLSYTFKNNNNIYNVKFTSPTDWIDRHRDIIYRIINTFNIK
ncbi:MAG: hypothetical protein IJ759_07305 [Bacteroidales bacterium]|nr:hypothetical protein [Bacteroidales bacterium]